jgi:hypothetical protein
MVENQNQNCNNDNKQDKVFLGEASFWEKEASMGSNPSYPTTTKAKALVFC